MIIVLPLFSLWFGYSGAARIGTIIFAAIFAITMNVAAGARSVPREYLEVARSFRSGRWRMLTDIVLPASMPYLLAGFRLAAGRALIGAVVAEFFLSIGGSATTSFTIRAPITTTRPSSAFCCSRPSASASNCW
jgi:ABC-type nitrate/sulfonate/bicarbonate transport system permease component